MLQRCFLSRIRWAEHISNCCSSSTSSIDVVSVGLGVVMTSVVDVVFQVKRCPLP